jgi:PST family polysaccharide transporter
LSRDRARLDPQVGRSKVLERRTISVGVFWRLVEVAGAEILAFAAFTISARLLLPEEFGTVALASLFVMTGQLLLHQGLGEALIQAEDIDDSHFSSAFWANVGLGALVAVGFFLIADPIAALLDEPNFAPVLHALAPTLLLFGASGIYQARLRRSLRIQGFAMASIASTLAGGIVAVTLAALGYGVWSLVAQQWTYATISLAVFAFYNGWLPSPAIGPGHLEKLGRFGGLVVVSALLRFAMRRLDLLILGYFVSTTQVGFYFLANRLMFSAGMLTYYSIQQIGLPVLSRLTNEPGRHQEALHNTLRWVSLVCLPTLIGMGSVADVLVPLVFGHEWIGSIWPFQILCGFSIFYALALMAGQILLSVRQAGLFLKLAAVNVLLFLVAVTLAAPHGIAAAALAGGLANMIAVPAYLLVLRQKVDLSFKRFFADQWPIWLATAAMSLSMQTFIHLAGGHLPLFLELVIAIALGGAVFLLLMLLISYDDVKDIYTSVAEMCSR